VLELGEGPGWKIERLGQIAQVFNGHRFKRPYADKGVTSGPGIVRFFTGNAITQTRGENIKYFDLGKAKPLQLKMLSNLYLERGMILITDSGTVGRVVVTTSYHEGAIGTNNLIRVVTTDEALTGYLYQFLSSELGQHQLKANIYGAIVDHIEPDEVKQVLVPGPTDRALLERIGMPVIKSMEHREAAQAAVAESETAFLDSLEHPIVGSPESENSADMRIFENLTGGLPLVKDEATGA
jgi:type I restriction enzyme M protein